MSHSHRIQACHAWVTAATAAALLLLVVTLVVVQWNNRTLASDVLLAVTKTTASPADRVYSVRRLLPGNDDMEPHGTLYLRGRAGLVLTWGNVVLGRSGNESWVVDQHDHVILSDSFQWIDQQSTGDVLGTAFLQELSLQSRQVPLMQLAAVSELMQHDYRVLVSRTNLNATPVDLLVGNRKRTGQDLPRRIRLWADAQSRVILQAELSWEPDNGVLLQLAPLTPVDRDWYQYTSHCDPTAQVEHVESASDTQ